jgi:pantoate--beta-alanine ligase
MPPVLIHEPSALYALSQEWRQSGQRVALVPTMGALHEGHLSLVRLAKQKADKVIATIFVNPTQFGHNEDFSRYPRTESADIAALASVVTDAVYLPSVAAMYPQGFATKISVAGVTDILCGAARPGHFDGVATVVCKLLLQAMPHLAIFGEKDYQQLQVIKTLVRDLNIPVEILGAPILREADGLAMSSRNRYLSAKERQIAPLLYATLCQLADVLQQREAALPLLTQAIHSLSQAGFSQIDYLELRDAEILAPLTSLTAPARLFIAARIGHTRLIDNLAIMPR